MAIKVAINGFGRIGRNVFRAIHEKYEGEIEVVAINDITDSKTLAYLLQYDSIYGGIDELVEVVPDGLEIAGQTIKVLAERDPAALPWKDLGVDVVVESTGFFTKREGAAKHLEAGAKKVIISAPATDPDITIALGVNDDAYDADKHHIISNASCTTNCLAPVAKVLVDNWGIENGFMTTVHAYTSDQRLHDAPHSDLRRARAAALNLIPTSTGAAKAISEVIPSLKGKLDGIAMRAPVPTGSVVDLVVTLSKPATKEQINDAFAAAAESEELEGILAFTDDPIVSSDIIGSEYSSIFDASGTMVNGTLAKVMSWYDNETGYSNRVADLIVRIAQ